MSEKADKNIFVELNKRGVTYSVGRAYLFDQRVYFIITSTRYKNRLAGLEFNERRGTSLLEREMNDEDFLSFNKAKEDFRIETQNKDGAVFEIVGNSLKKLIRKIERAAPELVEAIEKIVTAEAGENQKKAIAEASVLIEKL